MGSPGTAVFAGVVALAVAVAFGGAATYFVVEVAEVSALSDLPGGVLGLEVARFAVAAVALLAAVLLFARRTAGAVLAVVASLAGVITIVAEPYASEVLRGIGIGLGQYLEAMFRFADPYAFLLAGGLIAAPVLLLFAVLPSTLRWLRRTSR